MELIDASRPTELSPRAEEQIAKQQRIIENAYRVIHGIVDNERRLDGEDNAAAEKRLKRYHTRQGKAQVRHLLSGERLKRQAKPNSRLKAFEYCFGHYQRKGRPTGGLTIPVADLAAHLQLCERQTYRILEYLENQVSYPITYTVFNDSEGFKYETVLHKGVILRPPSPGKELRLVVTLPDSDEYLKELRDTIARGFNPESDADAIPDHLAVEADELAAYLKPIPAEPRMNEILEIELPMAA